MLQASVAGRARTRPTETNPRTGMSAQWHREAESGLRPRRRHIVGEALEDWLAAIGATSSTWTVQIAHNVLIAGDPACRAR